MANNDAVGKKIGYYWLQFSVDGKKHIWTMQFIEHPHCIGIGKEIDGYTIDDYRYIDPPGVFKGDNGSVYSRDGYNLDHSYKK